MDTNADKVIIDIQFVIGNRKEYYIKEMAVLQLEPRILKNYIFKPKFHFSNLFSQAKRQNYYIYKNINGLRWEDGDLEYHVLFDILKSIQNKEIIVKGLEKKKILQKILPSTVITDFEMETNLASCSVNNICCDLHTKRLNCRCALKTVYKIHKYMNDYNIL